MISNINLVIKLMKDSNELFLLYKNKKIHSEIVRKYRHETDFDYISSMCAGVCSQLKAGKSFESVDWGGLSEFARFSFMDQYIYEKYFMLGSNTDIADFIACLCTSQLMLDIFRYEMNLNRVELTDPISLNIQNLTNLKNFIN